MFRKILVGICILFAGMVAKGQDYDSVRLAQLPRLILPKALKSTGLPYKLDNSRNRHFPAIFTQFGYSCNQAATIAVGLTYELNAMRNLDAAYEENRLPAFFSWNMMNGGNPDRGASYFESWDLVDAIGCPNWTDYGNYFLNESRWMSGYYRYYRGMHNRIEDLYTIDVSTEEGLWTLKHWMYDHIGKYQPGGVANFQLATLDLQFWPLPEGTEEAGKIMIPWFGYAVGHAMTFTGYNDSVRYDFNNDGKYTNDLDTNGDGQVSMADWEIGALITVNTYGNTWGSEGRAYVPYRILPLHPDQGGIWMKSVVVAMPHQDYQPRLTLKAQVRYPDRSKIWITAGVSQDPDATEPQFILDQPVFHYQGGALPMQGRGPADPEQIEIGIDATRLLSHIESGKLAAFFLVVCEQDPGSTSEGSIAYFSINEYNEGELDHLGVQRNIPIDKPFIAIPVVFTPDFDGPVISSSILPPAAIGVDYLHKLSVTGGSAPYKWLPVENSFTETRFAAQFPAPLQNKVLPDSSYSERKTIALPFEFPYRGEVFHEITLTRQGGILLIPYDIYIPYGFELRELLGLSTAIYPFYSTEFQYKGSANGVYCDLNPAMATVSWNASLIRNGITTDVNFAARFYPSGIIEFYYGDFINNTSTPWLIGLTGGSKANSLYPTINAKGISNGLNIRFQPPILPANLHISADGYLTCKPLKPGSSWTIPVTVEDYQGIRSSRELSLSTASLGIDGSGTGYPAINIFPNPVTDLAQVEVESMNDGDIDVRIIDLTGKMILAKQYSIKAGRNLFTLHLPAGMQPGIYILDVTGVTSYQTKLYIGMTSG